MIQKQSRKKTAFEIYRAMAVGLVVLGHFSALSKDLPLIIKKICFSVAVYGLPLFFIISGFLLSASFVSILKRNGYRLGYSATIFLAKRILRIYPAYLISLALFSIVYDSSYLDVIVHFFNIHNFFSEFSRSINGVYWTLAIEFQWYIIAPILIVLFTKNNIIVQMLLLFLSILLSIAIRFSVLNEFMAGEIGHSDFIWLGHDQLYIYLFNFLIGVVLYNWRNSKIKIHFLLIIFFLAILFIIGYIQNDLVYDIHNNQIVAVKYKLLLGYFSLLVLGIVVFAFLDIELTKIYYRMISFISDISYSLYIYHFPVLLYIGSFNLAWYLFFPVYILTSIFVATISYYIIEVSFLKYSSKLGGK